MPFHGVRGDAEPLRDLLVGQAAGQFPQHVQFPLRQVGPRHAAEPDPGHISRINGFPRHGPVHDLDQAVIVVLLVPEALDADAPGFLLPLGLGGGRRQDDLDPRVLPFDLFRRGQPVDPVPHHHVQDQQICFMAVHIGRRVPGRPQPRQQLVADRRADIHLEEAAGDILVIRHDYPDPVIQNPSPPFRIMHPCSMLFFPIFYFR